MDRWILARCQTLINLVREEMAAYRLYTIVPRLVDLVEELTNWYIRFNRKRLKGENGQKDTIDALNTLFETLFTLCRTMSSYTPFITESVYQGLRRFIPDTAFGNDDPRSIHFLSFPEVKEEYFDVDIERQVKRMQSVIELTRQLRERHTLMLKVPLKELTIFHADPAYIKDIHPLISYIESELNIRNVIFTSDEEKTGVKYRVTADWPVLGKKLRKDMPKVKNALPSLSSDAVKDYVQTGKVNVAGADLIAGDLIVSRFIDLPADTTLATNTDNDVVVLLDTKIYPDLEAEGLAREMISRVQQLRKRAGVKATDDVEVFYSFANSTPGSEKLRDVLKTHVDFIRKTTRSLPCDVSLRKEGAVVVLEDEFEIGETKFNLSLVKI